MSLFGKLTYKADSSCSTRLLRFISDNSLPVEDLYEKNGELYFTVGYELKRDVEKYLDSIRADYSPVRETGLIKAVKAVLRKKGLLAGIMISVITITLLSNTVFCFNILTDDPVIRDGVLAVLYQDGIRAGTNIKNTDLTVIERDIKKKLDTVSWVGISVQGCRLTVDVVKNVDKPERTQKRLPTNLVAGENGTVDKIELLDGQLMTTVGSGVKKGDLLVSGDVLGDLSYTRHGFVKHFYVHYYTRSLGKIYGTFERTEKFFQPYSITEKTLAGEPEQKSFLTLFDAEIPLFFPDDKCSLTASDEESPLTFFGIELPVGIRTTTLREYSVTEKPVSETEAKACAEKLARTYEHNFLRDYDILSAEYNTETTDEGVCLTAKYKLYGVISKEVEFFINK